MAKKKNLTLPFLTCFWLVVVLFLSFYVLLQQTIFSKKAIGEDSPPKEVKISNINSQGFTVSWITDKLTTGSIIFSESRQAVENLDKGIKFAFDSRGETTFSKIHYVTLQNLSPSKDYFFAIKSGSAIFFKTLDGSWSKAGVTENQTTAPKITFDSGKPISPTNTEGAYSLEPGAWSPCGNGTLKGTINPCFRPNLIWGQVVNQNGEGIREAIVYLEIPGKSSLLSTLTGSRGKWSLNLANLFNEDLTEYLAYDPKKDLLLIRAEGEEKGRASVYRLIPRVFAEECLALSPKDCQKKPLDKTNPVILELTPLSPPS